VTETELKDANGTPIIDRIYEDDSIELLDCDGYHPDHKLDKTKVLYCMIDGTGYSILWTDYDGIVDDTLEKED
jgi:hypothetical protein